MNWAGTATRAKTAPQSRDLEQGATMSNSAYDRWLKFLAKPTEVSGLTFPRDESAAIIKASPPWTDRDWRRDKREINKAAKRARAARSRPKQGEKHG